MQSEMMQESSLQKRLKKKKKSGIKNVPRVTDKVKSEEKKIIRRRGSVIYFN